VSTEQQSIPPLAIQIESITPDLAEKYLESNVGNRTLRMHRVRSYAEQMSRDQWLMIGDPIRFDWSGALLDGQHRLQAVVTSGKTVNFVVIRNLLSESYVAMDSGLNRTPGDGLGSGVSASSHKAAGIRILFIVECDGDPRKTDNKAAVTRQDIHDYYVANTAVMEEACHVGQSMYGAVGGNRSAWIAFAVMAGRVDMVYRNKFLDAIKTGAGLQSGDPRLALRNWLVAKTNQKNNISGDHMSLYIKAWNDWMKGKKRMTMRSTTSDEAFPIMVTSAIGDK